MNKIILTLLSMAFVATGTASERMYIDENELDTSQNAFHIHVGSNQYIRTEIIHKDKTGLYTYESDITTKLDNISSTYEKTWKCPYCHQQNPMNQKCSNADCPSKYQVKK